jgi:hypothetical protein
MRLIKPTDILGLAVTAVHSIHEGLFLSKTLIYYAFVKLAGVRISTRLLGLILETGNIRIKE